MEVLAPLQQLFGSAWVAVWTLAKIVAIAVPLILGVAYMTFADFLGALGTVVNLPKGTSTTTVESKTNFFAPARLGSMVHGEATPLHRGRRTMVWQTRVTTAEGKLIALVTQTQLVL